MEKIPQILSISKRWHHHTASGGFDMLAQFLGGCRIDRHSFKNYNKLRRRTIDRYWKSPEYMLDYQYSDYLAERSAFCKAKKETFDIIHYLYGDDQLDLLLKKSYRLKSKLTATFHLPWFRSKERFAKQDKIIKKSLALGVAVSTSLAHDINKFLGEERCVYIPHGVDINVFKPAVNAIRRPGPLRLLSVGQHMRDLEFLHLIIDECYYQKFDIEFTLVGPEYFKNYFYGCRNINYLSDVSESELLNLYQTADALIMPVISSTANNAVLESISCGLPVIANKVDGITDYLDENSGWLLESRCLEAWLALVFDMSENIPICKSKSAAARKKAEQFCWEIVSARYLSEFSRIV